MLIIISYLLLLLMPLAMLLHLSKSSHKAKVKLHNTVINSVAIFLLLVMFPLGAAKARH